MSTSPLLRAQTLEALVGHALAALRAGTLDELLRQRRRTAQWLRRRPLAPVLGTAGDRLDDDGDGGTARATMLLLHWALGRVRPDRAGLGAPVAADDWLERTSWRPFLAVASHFGLLEVPAFNGRYRRGAGESAVDNLCGLWDVGPSTFYRYVDKGKRLMAEALLRAAGDADERLALRDAVHDALGPPADEGWHARQAAECAARRDPCAALWHALRGADAARFVDTLHRFRTELAALPEADALVRACLARPAPATARVDLLLAEAALWRVRDAAERESRAYEQALREAVQADDAVLLGRVYGALGWFHEPRDTDRAQASFEDSADYLRRAADAAPGDRAVAAEFVAALVRLAWLYVLRNDPRSLAVLERAEAGRAGADVAEESSAMLDQAWGEYWRRAGDARRAIAFKHKALNAFERLGDTRQVLSTHNNLSLLYIEAKEHERAIEHARRVAAAAAAGPVDPYLVASALGNLGIAQFCLERFDEAIETYADGLRRAEAARLNVIANRARYNLAEAHYRRFRERGDAADETAGDRLIAALVAAPPAERDALFQEAAPKLKAEVLGQAGLVLERLWPAETSAHFEEMSTVQRHRTALALPGHARDHIRAHLAIANAYLGIAAKEREAAVALIRQHGAEAEFEAELDTLRLTFSRELTREQALQAQWKQKCYGMLTEERAAAVLRQVLAGGSINKSGYAQLCQVGLATASKHLGTLADRGLLAQVGKGPSTRYVLR